MTIRRADRRRSTACLTKRLIPRSARARRQRAAHRGGTASAGKERCRWAWKSTCLLVLADHGGEGGRVGPGPVAVARDLRPGLLRHRDDADRRPRGTTWPGSAWSGPGHPAPGGPDDRRRKGKQEDGAGAAADLRPDARPEVGDRDGRVRFFRRHVQQLRRRAGRGPHRARSTSTCPAARRARRW